MLSFRSSSPFPNDSLQPEQHPFASLSLHNGGIAKIHTSTMGRGEINFNALHQLHGAWDWEGIPCQANGRIDVVDELKRANVHLVISRGTNVLADVHLSFDLLIAPEMLHSP